MQKVIIFLLAVVAASNLWAASGPEDFTIRGSGREGSLDTQWGPDVFGYRAKDSNEADGPDYQWIDISAIGDSAQGLGDDNFVGPFNIGWPFRFYWYDVSQFWIGSNGYIKFSTAGQLAQPIPQFPNATAPNDIVSPYAADWIFGGAEPGRCYYWSNNEDTLIVTWSHVRAWFNGGNVGDHSFQLILSGVDSSITFMYGTQTGDVSNNNTAVGIENLTGQIGISCFFGTYPTSNYAIKFTYPNPVTYTVHDLAIAGAQNEHSAGFFLTVNQPLLAWMGARNAGNQNETTFLANYSVRQTTNNALLAGRDSTLGAIAPAQFVDIPLPGVLWTPAAAGVYRCVGKVTLTSDIYRANDSIRTELHVVTLPGELYYDDNTSNRAWGWSGGQGGMANEFVPPVYPVEITQLRFFVVAAIPEGFGATILDDNGPLGAPGTTLWTQPVANPAANAWTSVNVPAGAVTINDGSFYVAWVQTLEGITFGLDTTSAPGISRRAWESSGGNWAENRLAQEADPMIRCTIEEVAQPNNPPGAFARLTPPDAQLPFSLEIDFAWRRSLDPDGDPVRYLFHLASPTWPSDLISLGDTVTSDTTLAVYIMVPLAPLDEIHQFFWTVRATDGEDTVNASNGGGNFQMDIPASADNQAPALVTEFSLGAFPNPFNNSVQLSYDVPSRSEISLDVYNLTGELVTTLTDGAHEAGRYSVNWNAEGFSSGVYFVVLNSASAVKIQKLLMVK